MFTLKLLLHMVRLVCFVKMALFLIFARESKIMLILHMFM